MADEFGTGYRAQGFPQIERRQDGGLEIKDRVYDANNTSYEAFAASLPAIGSPMLEFVPEAVLMNYTIKPGDQTSGHWYADLLYGTWGNPIWTLENTETSKPIELHVDYFTNWKKALAGTDTTASTPAFWSTRDTEALSTTEKDSWRWVSSDAECPSDMSIKEARTKPWIDNFVSGIIGARMSLRAPSLTDTSKGLSLAQMATQYVVGYRYSLEGVLPYQGANLPAEAAYWLMTDVSCVPDGYYWLFSLRLRYEPYEWDSDVYEEKTFSQVNGG